MHSIGIVIVNLEFMYWAKFKKKEVLNDVYEADLSGLGIEFEKYTNIGFDRCTKASPTELFINAEPQSVVMYPKKDSAPYPLKTVLSSPRLPRSIQSLRLRKTVHILNQRFHKYLLPPNHEIP